MHAVQKLLIEEYYTNGSDYDSLGKKTLYELEKIVTSVIHRYARESEPMDSHGNTGSQYAQTDIDLRERNQ